MPQSTTTPDRRLVWTIALTALFFGWLTFRIFDARDQLWQYGVDKTAPGAAVGWLAAVTAVAYVVLALLTARGTGRTQAMAVGLLAPAAICVLYAFTVAIGNGDKIGFPAAPLMLFAVVSMVAAVTTTVRTISAARQ